MSLDDYTVSRDLVADDTPFYGLVMAAMWRADPENLVKLINAWPEVYAEFDARFHATRGRLPGDSVENGELR